jgi:TonB family protein
MAWRSVAAGLLGILGSVAAAPAPEFRALKLKQPSGDFSVCRAAADLLPDKPSKVTLHLSLDAKGRVETIEFPEDASAWQRVLGRCAANELSFDPELRDGRESSTRAQLNVNFAATTDGAPGEARVASVNELATPPRLPRNSPELFERCLWRNPPDGRNWRYTIEATVGADGSITGTKLPADAPAWAVETTRCVAADMRLYPGTHDGEPVDSKVRIPFHYTHDTGGLGFESPKPPTDREVIEAAYRACYPPDQLAMGSVLFNFDVTVDGEVRRAKIVRSSGDIMLDQAAACILPRLHFEPSRRDGKPIPSNISWELPVRPAR